MPRPAIPAPQLPVTGAAAARDAKRRAEEGVAAILGGSRKVIVVGEVSAVLAAAERS